MEKQELINEMYALRAGLSTIAEDNEYFTECGKKAYEEYNVYGKEFIAPISQKCKIRRTDKNRSYFLTPKLLGYERVCDSIEVPGWTNPNAYIERYRFEQRSILDKQIRERGMMVSWNKDGYSQRDYKEGYSEIVDCDRVTLIENGYNNAKVEQTVKIVVASLFAAIMIICILCAQIISPLFYIAVAASAFISLLIFWLVIKGRSIVKGRKYKYELACSYPEWEGNVKQIVKKMENKAVPVLNSTNALLKVLRERYAGLIDERDWEHLDLIIFYLETGRADTMKEALLLVEREVQTQRIIQAINEATERICSAIRSAANRISAQLNTISNQLTTVIGLQTAQIAQTNRLISQNEMRNALLKKANVTSTQLMNDVSRICTYITN